MKPPSSIPDASGRSGGRSMLHPESVVVPVRRDWVARAVLWLALVLLALSAFGVWLRFRPVPYQTQRWMEAGGFDRGRMLESLLSQTNFVGFPRVDVEHYLGPANFDERQFWYDLGPSDPSGIIEPRANVGDSLRLYGVFSYDRDGQISQILYNRRRPVLGSAPFDSAGWFGSDRAARRMMFTRTLGELRARSLDRATIEALLGPPDGGRVRAHYDVGLGGDFFGSQKALVLEFDHLDVVTTTMVID